MYKLGNANQTISQELRSFSHSMALSRSIRDKKWRESFQARMRKGSLRKTGRSVGRSTLMQRIAAWFSNVFSRKKADNKMLSDLRGDSNPNNDFSGSNRDWKKNKTSY